MNGALRGGQRDDVSLAGRTGQRQRGKGEALNERRTIVQNPPK